MRHTEQKKEMPGKTPGDNTLGGQAGLLDEGPLVTATYDLAARY